MTYQPPLPIPPTREQQIADRLWADYVHYWRATAAVRTFATSGRYFRELKPTAERLARLERLVVWCRARGFEARTWLKFLFRSRKWRFAPKIDRDSDLMSPNPRLQTAYKMSEGLHVYRASRPEAAYDPNRDLDPNVERKKLLYVQSGSVQACLAQLLELTLGYHPRSEACQQCPLAGQCRQALEAFCDFDVMALREGRISSTEAQLQAFRSRGG